MHPVVSNQTRPDLILASEVGSLHPVSFTWCRGQVGLQAGFSSFYNDLRSTAELPIECRIPTYCPLCLLSSNILQACATLVKTKELTLGNNRTSDLIPFFQLFPLSLCAPQAGGCFAGLCQLLFLLCFGDHGPLGEYWSGVVYTIPVIQVHLMSSHNWARAMVSGRKTPECRGFLVMLTRGTAHGRPPCGPHRGGPSPSSVQGPSPSLAFLTREVRGWLTAPPAVTLIRSVSRLCDGASFAARGPLTGLVVVHNVKPFWFPGREVLGWLPGPRGGGSAFCRSREGCVRPHSHVSTSACSSLRGSV